MAGSSVPAASAARAIAGALARHALTAIGTSLVARGWIDQDSVTGAVPALADETVGVLLVVGASGWAWARAHLTHTRWAAAWRALAAPQP